MAILAYARTSTADKQTLDSQIDALERSGYDKLFADQKSGKNTERAEFQRMMEYAREGDTIKVYSLSRLSRSTKDAIEIAETLKQRNISLISLSENIDTTTPAGKLYFTIMAAINEMQREQIVSATIDGLAAARARGRVGGRPKKDPKKVELAMKLYDQKDMTIKEISIATGLSESTIYKYARARREAKAAEAANVSGEKAAATTKKKKK